MIDLEYIDRIADNAHRGQTRRLHGEPYIVHPRRVADAVTLDVTKAVALLHDVIEDTPLTADDLLAMDVPLLVVAYVEILTRRADESYRQYILRVIREGGPIVWAVKAADILDNLSDLPEDDSRRERYEWAYIRLLHARGEQFPVAVAA